MLRWWDASRSQVGVQQEITTESPRWVKDPLLRCCDMRVDLDGWAPVIENRRRYEVFYDIAPEDHAASRAAILEITTGSKCMNVMVTPPRMDIATTA